MKKIINLVVGFALLFGVVFPNMINVVHAESNAEIIEGIDWEGSGFKDVKITVRDTPNYARSSGDTEPSVEIDYVIEKTGEVVHFERIGNEGYHYVNGELITTMSFSEVNINSRAVTVPTSIRDLGFAPASGFSNFYYAGYYTWEVKALKNYIVSELQSQAESMIVEAIIAALPGGLITILATKAYDAASDIYGFLTSASSIASYFDGVDFNAVDVLYGSYNGQCNILAWYGYKAFVINNSNTIVTSSGSRFVMNANHTWDGNPQDYTQPSACRVLVGTYPY